MPEDFCYKKKEEETSLTCPAMYICSPAHMQELEAELISSGIPAETLMNDAARQIAEAIPACLPACRRCLAYIGKGNNGGDAIAVLRFLREKGWHVSIRSPFPVEEWSPLAKKQLSLLPDAEIAESPIHSPLPPGTLILDGILGLGSRKGLNPPLTGLCDEINQLRIKSPRCKTWAIDLPTGVDADTGIPDEHAIIADITSPIGTVKRGLVADEATRYVGRLIPIPIQGLHPVEREASICTARTLLPLIAPRDYELFKNKAGHVGIIAGSPGMTGAARLCAEAALRAGAGLVTLFVREDIYPIVAAATPAAIMVKPVGSFADIEHSTFSSLLIGPGLGTPNPGDSRAIVRILREFSNPIVLDADGLNLAAHHGWKLGANILATPHPGEIRRLLKDIQPGTSRIETARAFTQRHQATLILKGARSIITASGKQPCYNTSGGPAMATAGQGDVLAGICSGLCAQGIPLFEAACLGAYLCGKSSDILVFREKETEQTLTAHDTLAGLAQAFLSLA